MFDKENRYIISNYHNKPTFSSFLPGIAGTKGIPAWVYYNNRGQGVCSFGAQDKDHSIMEFCPAHVSYQNNARTGFRTFLKINGNYTELLTEHTDMHIGMADLILKQRIGDLQVQVSYYGLPNQPVAALVRMLTVENTGTEELTLELLDGMSAVVCYGIGQESLKMMTQLSKAWMLSQFAENGATYFRVRASMEDTACVTQVQGVNFAYAVDEDGKVLESLVQPDLIFGQDTGLSRPEGFIHHSLEALRTYKQVTSNQFPCCFFIKERKLLPGEKATVFSVFGQGNSAAKAEQLVKKISGPEWFYQHHTDAITLVESLTDQVFTQTSNPIFDGYCQQTYLDNLLRGGTPIFFKAGSKQVPFYLYSRKHGDPEREYNYFSVGNAYYAQGNGNFRDVNQNRRSDILFHPALKTTNIRMFYELIQTDGYNPLVIQASTFRLAAPEAEVCIQLLPKEYQNSARNLLSKDFTPGQLAMAAEEWGIVNSDDFVSTCIVSAVCDPRGTFGEGYWCDHWTYNLDLIESYLSVYPEEKQHLLFSSREYRWFASQAAVLPRTQRYVSTEHGLRQYKSIDETLRQNADGQWLTDSQGKLVVSTLIEKLLLLSAIKTTTLDSEGMGVEMEGGKPGWYDALNGLPGLFGSSMAESCELLRLLNFTIAALNEHSTAVELYEEIAALLDETAKAAEISCSMERWLRMNQIREAYRQQTVQTLTGNRQVMPSEKITEALSKMQKIVQAGIEKAEAYGDGLIPTYFYFEADAPDADGIPQRFQPTALPYFLEGPVRRLKTPLAKAEKENLHQAVKASALYDQALHMYKVNASLRNVSYEVGRTRAFTPGWLENESIWLHMEYKYLLELLKNELYEPFFEDFHSTAIPFQNPEVYGRSPLENVSFLASSALPDTASHGRGFVARLSGSTAEFLQIWNLMFFGSHPFRYKNHTLTLQFSPAVPAYLVPENGLLEATFLGAVHVTYHCPAGRDLIPGTYSIQRWDLEDLCGNVTQYTTDLLPQDVALRVRNGEIVSIDVYLA